MRNDKITAVIALMLLLANALISPIPQVVVYEITQNGIAAGGAATATGAIGAAVIAAVGAKLSVGAVIALGLGWVGLAIVAA